MGRRNYDLTGVGPGSPAWIAKQERNQKRERLPGVLSHRSKNSDVCRAVNPPVDTETIPQALPVITEQRMEDLTPTAPSFPTQEAVSEHRHAVSVPAHIKRHYPPRECNSHEILQRLAEQAQQPIARGNFTRSPFFISVVPQLQGFQHHDPMEIQAPAQQDTLQGLQWQPMTLVDYHVGNMVLEALANQSAQETSPAPRQEQDLTPRSKAAQ